MRDGIEDILAYVYRIDPSLKKEETELVKILSELLEIKPDLEPDAEFVEKLKARIMETTPFFPAQKQKLWLMQITLRDLVFSGGGVVFVVALLMSGGFLQYPAPSTELLTDNDNIEEKIFKPADVFISYLGDGAFGNLSGVTFATPTEIGGGPGEDVMHYVPHYYYAGGDFKELIPDKDDIFKGILDVGGMIPTLEDLNGRFNFNLFDLKNIDPKISSIKFCEQSSNGYCFDTFFDQGYVRMDARNYTALQGNYDHGAYATDEERAIAIADDLMRKYGVNMQSYGRPVLKESYYNQRILVYPLQINGREVYDEFDAIPTGITVYVDLAYDAVYQVELPVRNYEASAYETEKDAGKITAAIDQYVNWHNKDFEDPQLVDLAVDSPELCYRVRTELMSDNIHYQEYLLPALAFKVKDSTRAAEIGAEKTVIVPIAKGFFQSEEGG